MDRDRTAEPLPSNGHLWWVSGPQILHGPGHSRSALPSTTAQVGHTGDSFRSVSR